MLVFVRNEIAQPYPDWDCFIHFVIFLVNKNCCTRTMSKLKLQQNCPSKLGKITHELFPMKQPKSACGDLIRVLIILRLNLQISSQCSVLYLSRYIGTVAH